MNLDQVKISKNFSEHFPSAQKLNECHNYFRKHGYLDRQIVVDDNGYLIDGYIGYIIVRAQGLNNYPVATKINFDEEEKYDEI